MIDLRRVRVGIPDSVEFALWSCGNSWIVIEAERFDSSAVGHLVPFRRVCGMHDYAPHLSRCIAVWPIWDVVEINIYIQSSGTEHTWLQSSLGRKSAVFLIWRDGQTYILKSGRYRTSFTYAS